MDQNHLETFKTSDAYLHTRLLGEKCLEWAYNSPEDSITISPEREGYNPQDRRSRGFLRTEEIQRKEARERMKQISQETDATSCSV